MQCPHVRLVQLLMCKRGQLAQMAAQSTSDWKFLSSNLAGSNENSNQYKWPIAFYIHDADNVYIHCAFSP